MNTLLLLVILAFVSKWHQYGLDQYVINILGYPSKYYDWAFLFVVITWTLYAMYRMYLRVIPALARFNSALSRFRGTVSFSQLPKKGNGKRSYSTSSRSSEGVSTQVPIGASGINHPKPIKSGGTNCSPFLKRFKVTDPFFRTISTRGSLVSLLRGKARKGLPSLATLFQKLGFRLFGAVFPAKGKYLSRLRQLNAFRVHLDILTKHHGQTYTVKYLKASTLAVQKAIAGTPVHSLRELEPALPLARVTANGLPKWIPIRDRRLIFINHSSSVIRWYLTLLSVYRVISIPGVMKLSTITDGLTVSQDSIDQVVRDIISIIPKAMFDLSILMDHKRSAMHVGRGSLPPIKLMETASATTKVSWLGFITDIMALQHHSMLNDLISFMMLTGQDVLAKLAIHIRNHSLQANLPALTGLSLLGMPPIGQLAKKDEAAGKVRIFAMVTIWDQIVLEPLHRMLFDVLKMLPNDGTFNQGKSVERCLHKSQQTGCSFGYDLSAATDRLPLSLQMAILNHLSSGIGFIWARILASRDYLTPKEKGKESYPVRYAVGQPMGALSSWAMLAITHHFIAQLAAYRARAYGALDPNNFWKEEWYTGYEVLGDDIVFFESDVATQYLTLMDSLGVPINLAKSVVAKNPTFEFAKVTGHYGTHVAALSWAMFMAQPTAMGRVGILWSLMSKGFVKTHIIRYINTISRESKYVVGNPNLFYLALGTMFSNKGRIKFSEFLYTVLSFEEGKVTILDKLNKPLTALTRGIAAAFHSSDSEPVRLLLSQKPGAINDLSVSDLSLKMALVKVIKLFIYGAPTDTDVRVNYLNPHKDALRMAEDVVMNMITFNSEAREIVRLQLKEEGVFTLKPKPGRTLSPNGLLVHPVFCLLFTQYYEFFLRKWEILTKVKPLKLKGLTFGELMDLMDHIDRYREATEISDRARKKLAREDIPSKNLIENPLEVLRRVLKSESNIESMRQVVISAGVEVITKIFAGNDTASYSIFNQEAEDNPGYRAPRSVPLEGIKSYIRSHGEEFVQKHLPQWGHMAGYMFKEPGDQPEFIPFNYLQGQPDYLYSISIFDALVNLDSPMQDLLWEG